MEGMKLNMDLRINDIGDDLDVSCRLSPAKVIMRMNRCKRYLA